MARLALERLPELERMDTAAAAGLVALPAPLDLDDFADSRTRPGPVDMGPEASPRDLIREALEELADCRNYLVWRIQQLRTENGGTFEVFRVQAALAVVVLAWRAVKRLEG